MPVRFQVLSDLHIDSYARRDLPIGEIPYANADAILVAGDTSNGLWASNGSLANQSDLRNQFL